MALPPDNEFDLARKRAKQQEAANLQGQNDAIARRAAQTGGGVNGALVKQEGVAADQSAQRLQAANEGIDTAQRTEERRLAEIEQGRQFAREERLGSQEFQGGQGALQRAFATSERMGGQEFQGGQGALQRAFATSERMGGQDYGSTQASLQRDFTSGESALQRKFATTEREGAQTFQGDQAGLQRTFLTGERTGAETFAGGQGDLNRQLQTDLQSKQLQQQIDLQGNELRNSNWQQERTIDLQKDLQSKQLAQQLDLQGNELRNSNWQQERALDQAAAALGFSKEQFAHQIGVDNFNMDMANKMFNDRDFMEKLLSPEGVGDVPVLGKLLSQWGIG